MASQAPVPAHVTIARRGVRSRIAGQARRAARSYPGSSPITHQLESDMALKILFDEMQNTDLSRDDIEDLFNWTFALEYGQNGPRTFYSLRDRFHNRRRAGRQHVNWTIVDGTMTAQQQQDKQDVLQRLCQSAQALNINIDPRDQRGVLIATATAASPAVLAAGPVNTTAPVQTRAQPAAKNVSADPQANDAVTTAPGTLEQSTAASDSSLSDLPSSDDDSSADSEPGAVTNLLRAVAQGPRSGISSPVSNLPAAQVDSAAEANALTQDDSELDIGSSGSDDSVPHDTDYEADDEDTHMSGTDVDRNQRHDGEDAYMVDDGAISPLQLDDIDFGVTPDHDYKSVDEALAAAAATRSPVTDTWFTRLAAQITDYLTATHWVPEREFDEWVIRRLVRADADIRDRYLSIEPIPRPLTPPSEVLERFNDLFDFKEAAAPEQSTADQPPNFNGDARAPILDAYMPIGFVEQLGLTFEQAVIAVMYCFGYLSRRETEQQLRHENEDLGSLVARLSIACDPRVDWYGGCWAEAMHYAKSGRAKAILDDAASIATSSQTANGKRSAEVDAIMDGTVAAKRPRFDTPEE